MFSLPIFIQNWINRKQRAYDSLVFAEILNEKFKIYLNLIQLREIRRVYGPEFVPIENYPFPELIERSEVGYLGNNRYFESTNP